jgi:outer membrane protein TolC
MRISVSKHIIVIFFLVVGTINGFSQQRLGFQDYMTLVRSFHPVALQAALNEEIGKQNLRAARGGFDPALYSNIGQKYFENDQYYSLVDAGLKVPTWFGLDFYAGFEQNSGVNLNPERKTPENGLAYAGVSLPVGQGLFIDQRRADVRQAQLFEQITYEEQRLMLNSVLRAASNAYWNWFAAYEIVQIFEKGVELAQERFEGIRESAIQGDLAIIDTVEAFILVQNRLIGLEDALLSFRNAGQELSVFLWADNLIPLEITDELVPEKNNDLKDFIVDELITNTFDSLINNHPIMLQNQLTIGQLEIERRWKAEQLKPVVNLKYNFLNEPVAGAVINGATLNNYNWGLQFYMPLFLRKERGQLNLTKLKILDAELDLENQRLGLKAAVQKSVNTWETTREQVLIFESAVVNLERLLNAEISKFDVGESSIFLINTREDNFINGQIRLTNLIANNQKALVDISFQLGILGD